MNVLALIPARVGSKGIPRKNFKPLAGKSPLTRAVECVHAAGLPWPVVTSDGDKFRDGPDADCRWLHAHAPLHTDECPMIDVVTDALARVPGPSDQIIVLLQPTQPMRQPKHIRAAIALLQETQADSVVSVKELPRDLSPRLVCDIADGRLWPWIDGFDWDDVPGCRQHCTPVYQREGTVYAFRRQTVERYRNIYGQDVRPLIIPAEDTCSLDSLADWAEAERRLTARS